MTYLSVCLYFYSVSVCSHLLIELGGKMWVIIRQESNCEYDSLLLLKYFGTSKIHKPLSFLFSHPHMRQIM